MHTCLAYESQLTIQTENHSVQFDIVIADTPEKRSLGLMHQSSMPEHVGMLFDYHQVKKVSMWMKNTAIALDMLFIDKQGLVVKVHQNALPYSEEIISSEEPVMAVLEINAGLANKHGIVKGSRVQHMIFSNE